MVAIDDQQRASDLWDQARVNRETMRDSAERRRSVNDWIAALRENAARAHASARAGDLEGEISYWLAIAANAIARAEVVAAIRDRDATAMTETGAGADTIVVNRMPGEEIGRA